MRKVFIYLSIFAILLSMFSFSASASAYDGSFVNLLESDSYRIRYSTQESFISDYPVGNTGNVSNVTVTWDNLYSSTKLSSIYVNIRASNPISTCRLGTDSENGVVLTALGSYDGLYQFKLNLTDYTFKNFVLRVFFGSAYNTEFLVESVYGIGSEAIPVTQANHNSYYVYFDHDVTPDYTVPSQQHIEGGIIQFPYTMNFTKEVYPVNGFEWYGQRNILEIYPTQQSIKDFGKVSILIASNRILTASASLNVGGIKDVVPCELKTMYTAQKWPGYESQYNFFFWALDYYEITVDLTGYDLSGPNACLYLYFDNEAYEYAYGYNYTYNNIIGAWIYPIIPEIPWYQKMWNWISGGFDRVTDTLQSIFGDSSNGSLGAAGDQMSGQAQEMDQANDVMNNVARPDIDPNELFGDSLNFSPGGMMVLTSLTNNSVIAPILLVVCTLALAGFIFFGKR